MKGYSIEQNIRKNSVMLLEFYWALKPKVSFNYNGAYVGQLLMTFFFALCATMKKIITVDAALLN